MPKILQKLGQLSQSVRKVGTIVPVCLDVGTVVGTIVPSQIVVVCSGPNNNKLLNCVLTHQNRFQPIVELE